MKPKNFPERKRQRQKRALVNLPEPTRKAGESLAHFHGRPDVIEYRTLESAVSQGTRRDVRTKKQRDTTARMFRTA